MRSRVLLFPLLGVAFITAACSSGSSTSSSPPASSAPATSASAASAPAATTPAATGSASSSSGSSSASGEIKTNWDNFFSGKSSAATKISLLENGQKFASVINAQAGTSLAASAVPTVTGVVMESPTTATVSYNIAVSGASLNNQTGTAVYEDGVWKVSDVSFCALLTLENLGKAPSVCSSAG
jgi:hypothetical protein